MRDEENVFGVQLGELSKEDWLDQLEDFALDHGFFEPLGSLHSAVYSKGNETLLVTFEAIDSVRARTDSAEPLGFEIVRMAGFSHLALIADGDTWFRSDRVYAFFDKLIDEGFFDDFEHIVFYGYGMSGYAAAAFSVAAPGAQVIAIQPQASLDPRVAGWDRRFLEMRRTSFTDRYGYAPDMLDACDKAYIIYDSERENDAMHASLFTKKNVVLVRCPHLGGDIEDELLKMDVLTRMLVRAGRATLTDKAVHRLLRARRTHTPYLRRLLGHLAEQNKPKLTAALCRYILKDRNLPFARRILQRIRTEQQG